ncbi:follicle cell protein 3C-1 [Athalia rosae]|uniref:follicle cell protein 3C-1 n=1 Tax=Athalia rosae TaxID=37344 RepID=UPI0020343949|nr:follicle cell protein 3C-1 [Athalia rosae]
MQVGILIALLCMGHIYASETTNEPGTCSASDAPTTESPIGCVCGVFLSGQFKKNSKDQPKGNPAMLHEHPDTFPCTIVGNKLCTNKCLDTIVKYLPNSPAILCGSIDRDCHKERAYLFIKNCKDEWMNTNLSAGREYCSCVLDIGCSTLRTY